MALVCRWILTCSFLLLASPGLLLAGEDSDFVVASQRFVAGFYDMADHDFGEFAKKYPNSPRLPDAILFQAESRVRLANYAGALQVLAAHQPQAGKRADEFLFWTAEAQFHKGDFPAASDSFAKLAQEYPASPRRLEASVGEAAARSQLAQWPRVIELLRQTNGVFQSTVQSSPANTNLTRGYLLLSAAYLAQKDLGAAEAALQPLSARPLDASTHWQRQLLLCRILMTGGRNEDALQGATNLMDLAVKAGQRTLQAESAAFQAGLFEHWGRTNDAIAAYKRNLTAGTPAEGQRQALLQITALYLAQNKIGEAAQTLDQFLEQHPKTDAAELALVTLGELCLRQHEAGVCTNLLSTATTNSAPPNCLALALTNLHNFVSRFPQSPLFGRAQFALGRCFWIEGQWAESQAAFQSAAERLPRSPDQAMAYFKVAEVQVRQKNFTGAITNYTALLDKFADLPEVKTNLFEPALYQMVQVALNADDRTTATNALARLLAGYPQGRDTDGAVLLTAQALNRSDPPLARKLVSDRLRQVPQTPLRPDLELAIAATYEQQEQWTNVIEQYNVWLASFTNHAAAPRALYSRAWAYWQAGQATNALAEFTRFPEQFPTNDLAPLARWWVGDHYLTTGDFYEAERNYKRIYDQWPASTLAYPAHLRAAQAALLREMPDNAKDYLNALLSDTKSPSDPKAQTWIDLKARAWIALGDTFLSRGSTNKSDDYSQAINAYNQVGLYSSNNLAALALGAKASCLLQLAKTAEDFDSVSNTFQRVIDFPTADLQARSAAKIGLAQTLELLARLKSDDERTALQDLALRHYTDVLWPESFLRPGEKPDRFWTQKAGLEAARLAEARNQLQPAIKVYERLRDLFPTIDLNQKISALKAKLAAPR